MKGAWKALCLFMIGGTAYIGVELLWRGHTHWTMFVMGGALFLILGGLNEFLPWEMPLVLQGAVGAGIVTAAEFAAGLILNVWLGLGVWDYSKLPFNVMGQICLLFSIAWFGLSIVAIVLDDWLRYWLFREDKPHYSIF